MSWNYVVYRDEDPDEEDGDGDLPAPESSEDAVDQAEVPHDEVRHVSIYVNTKRCIMKCL